MSITERVLKDGTKVYDVVEYVGFTVDGRRDRKSVTCRTKGQAKIEQARLVSMRDAMRGRSGRVTLIQYIEERYWPAASDALAATSRDTYRREIELRILPSLGRHDIRDIDRGRIQSMVDACSTAAVARKAVGVLKTILNEAKGDGLIPSNPAEARFRMPPAGRKRDNGLVITTFGAMRPLLEALDALGDESVRKIALTGLLMGLRPEERYGLDCSDIDVAAGTVSVSSAYVAASAREGGNQLKGTKTEKSTRVLPLHPRVAALASAGEDGPWIRGADGGRISPSTAQKRWRAFLRRCDAAGLDVPHVTIENMRHSYATSYLHAGGSVEDLSRMLGHSDINTTYRRYVRPSADDLKAAAAAIVPDF